MLFVHRLLIKEEVKNMAEKPLDEFLKKVLKKKPLNPDEMRTRSRDIPKNLKIAIGQTLRPVENGGENRVQQLKASLKEESLPRTDLALGLMEIVARYKVPVDIIWDEMHTHGLRFLTEGNIHEWHGYSSDRVTAQQTHTPEALILKMQDLTHSSVVTPGEILDKLIRDPREITVKAADVDYTDKI